MGWIIFTAWCLGCAARYYRYQNTRQTPPHTNRSATLH